MPTRLTIKVPRHPAVIDSPETDESRINYVLEPHETTASLHERLIAAMPDRNYIEIGECFAKLILRAGPRQALETLIKAGTPYTHVGRHSFYGEFRPLKISNDHSFLGVRSAIRLSKHLEPRYELLPLLQAAWYFPKGIDICGQATLPGFYGGYGDTIHALRTVLGFMDVSRYPVLSDWAMFPRAQCRFQCDTSPIVLNDKEVHFSELSRAVFNMEPERSLRLFLGLALDPANRPRLKSEFMFISLTDQQERLAGGSLKTQQHPTVRARDLFDLLDYFDWENLETLAYAVVPDVAAGPRHYELHDLVATTCMRSFGGKQEEKSKEGREIGYDEAEEFVRAVIGGSILEVVDEVTAALTSNFSVSSLLDALMLASARIITLAEIHGLNPFEEIHIIDYIHTLSIWCRESGHPRTLYAPYFAAIALHHSIPPLQSPKFLEKLSFHTLLKDDRHASFELLDEALAAHDSNAAVGLAHSLAHSHGQNQVLRHLALCVALAQDNPHHQQLAVVALHESRRVATPFKLEMLSMLAAYTAGIRTEAAVTTMYEKFFRPNP